MSLARALRRASVTVRVPVRAFVQRQSPRGSSCSRHRKHLCAHRAPRTFFRVHACTHAPVTRRMSARASARLSPRVQVPVTARQSSCLCA
ncbi:hypothetical protein CRG98_005470 [Punica granatum]|uniref:Uncharacterized protein n=1 Tax=Punica granatum TaxID=22663 RepID=A0A2I0L081_PUNGR|nr:hypothetical protein CRG98_005470 [Punica granatum]